MSELNKYFQRSETVELLRSQISPSSYNPRKITTENRKSLKQSIKQYGVVGGMVVNKQTGYTLVSGHQKLSILDELNKYDPDTNENDYLLKVEVIDVDEKTEKELNIYFNNPNSQGQWDYDSLRDILPEIDYKMAGLTDQDLNLIGVDYLLETEAERSISNSLDEFMEPVISQKQAEKQAKKELSREEKIEHSKKVKGEVNQGAQDKVDKMESYVMITFDSMDAKADFMDRFGFDPFDKFIKGEAFSELIERVE